MAESIRGTLPPVYGNIFNEFFDRPKVVETRATCDTCSMCDHGQPSPVAMEFFNSDTKCCTFTPVLPNYLVGAILSDESPEMAEGKRRVREAIAKRIGVQPHCLNRPRKLTLLMQGYGAAFGRSKTLLCPYYDGANPEGSCTIWRHRESICMTYYCKYSGGMRGYEYWTALKVYLSHVQRVLARKASAAVDRTVVEPVFATNELTLEDMEDLPPKDSDYAAWWGKWVGREEEFYVQCHEWVRSLTPSAFAGIIDEAPDGKKVFNELVAKYDVLANRILPTSLVRNARMKEAHVGDQVVVTTYHRYDSFALDKELFEVVGMFAADQTLEQNLERLKGEGIELAPELIEFLFAAGVLVEPKKKGPRNWGPTDQLTGRRAALSAILEARVIPLDASASSK
ncbi:MAG TPA: hypothetical protein VM925_30250, partial [Labilithrix sp.]|nr:hypothetical protein [Labilithrix sp.]